MFGHNDQTDDQNNNQFQPPVDDNQSQSFGSIGTPPPPADDDQPSQNQTFDPPSTNDNALDQLTAAPLHDDSPTDSPQHDDSTNDLIDLKSKALNQLAPLVDHLDQSPEERFRTTMMMIQASDNQSLIKDAYEAAQQIPDEKAKAQALLDVVNEINYFTQHHND